MEQIWEKIHDSIDSYFESKHMFNITCSVITFLKRTCYNSSLYLDSEFENSIFVFDRILKFDFCVLSKLNIRSFVFDLIWKIDFCVLSNFKNRFLCLSAAYFKKQKVVMFWGGHGNKIFVPPLGRYQDFMYPRAVTYQKVPALICSWMPKHDRTCEAYLLSLGGCVP